MPFKYIRPSHSATKQSFGSNSRSLAAELLFPNTNRLMAVVKTGIFKKILPMDWKTKNNLETKSNLSSKLAIAWFQTMRV